MIDDKEAEALAAHVRSAGNVVECALIRLGNENRRAFDATVAALNGGSMLMVKTTAGSLGMVVVALDLLLPDGEPIHLMSVELEHPVAPSIN